MTSWGTDLNKWWIFRDDETRGWVASRPLPSDHFTRAFPTFDEALDYVRERI